MTPGTISKVFSGIAGKYKLISPSVVVRGLATDDSWSANPTYEKNLEIGRDLEHWLVVVNRPLGFREDKIDSYIKTLASVVGRYSYHV